jgi:hypothetical protein
LGDAVPGGSPGSWSRYGGLFSARAGRPTSDPPWCAQQVVRLPTAPTSVRPTADSDTPCAVQAATTAATTAGRGTTGPRGAVPTDRWHGSGRQPMTSSANGRLHLRAGHDGQRTRRPRPNSKSPVPQGSAERVTGSRAATIWFRRPSPKEPKPVSSRDRKESSPKNVPDSGPEMGRGRKTSSAHLSVDRPSPT